MTRRTGRLKSRAALTLIARFRKLKQGFSQLRTEGYNPADFAMTTQTNE